jgi:ParB-like nuclease domain
MKEVRIACQGAASVPLEKLLPFQGELKSLSKENYEKLRSKIEDLGFSEPISIWRLKDGFYIINGHQRLRVLQKMREEGWFVPPLPVSWVEADTLQEAKRKVLSLASQYGTIESQGLYEFMETNNLQEDLATLSFPDIDLEKFEEEFYETKEKEEAPPKEKCPTCGRTLKT